MKLPEKWFPQPMLSLVLLLIWLLLVNSMAPGHIILGAVLGFAIPHLTADFWPRRPRIHHPGILLRFILRVILDIITANLAVARLILNPATDIRPRFIYLPLTLEDRFAIVFLTSTISLTPGTVSVDLSRDRRRLLIHCLNVDDEAALLARIKTRYETPLKEVFESC